MEMEYPFHNQEEDWKCRKHPSQTHNGVCATCLRNRLLLLCPECTEVIPCACACTWSSSPRLSSYSGGSHRSKSTAFQVVRRSSGDVRPPPSLLEDGRKSSFWSLFRSEKKAATLPRSASVGFPCDKDAGGRAGRRIRRWFFPSLIKAFRWPKTASERSHSFRR